MTPRRPATVPALGLARTRAHGALVAGIAVTVAVSVAVVCALIAWVSVDTQRALRDVFGGADTPYAQVQTRIATDEAAQNAVADDVLRGLFGDAAAVQRIVVGDGDSARVAWQITPDVTTLDPDRLARLQAGVERLELVFRESDASVGGLEVSGTLAEAAASASVGVAASRAIAPVPVALVAVLAWFAVFELARLVGAARAREQVLLRGRGASGVQLGIVTLIEVSLVTVAAAVVGVGAAIGVLGIRAQTDGIRAVLATWPWALLLGLLLLVTAFIRTNGTGAASAAARSGRVSQAATIAAGVLVLLGAAVAVWQLSTSREAAPDDPLRVAMSSIAPTLGLAAAAIVIVVLCVPLSALVARLAAGRVRLSPVYPTRQVARRIAAFSTAIALVVIAMGGATLAAAYLGTWERASGAAAAVSAGAELRATGEEVTASTVAAAPGDAAAVITAPLVVSESPTQLVAIATPKLADILLPMPGIVDPAEIADDVAPSVTGVALPDDADAVHITALTQSGDDEMVAQMTVRAWFIDANGTPARSTGSVTIEPDGDNLVMSATVPLPDGAAPWRLISADATIPRSTSAGGPDAPVFIYSSSVAALTGDVEVPLDADRDVNAQLTGFSFGSYSTAVLYSAAGDIAEPIPAVITSALAAHLGVTSGDRFDARFDGTGRTIAMTVARVVDVLPGARASSAVLVSLEALAIASVPSSPRAGAAPDPPSANEIWASGADAAAFADATGMTADVPVDTAAAVTGGLVPAWWAAAIGAAALAGVALVALLVSLARQRGGEVLVLRAAGVSPRVQARMRAVEAVVIAGLATVLGIGTGIGLAVLIVPVLVASAVPGGDIVAGLQFTPWPLAIAVVELVTALIIAVGLMTVSIRRLGSSTRLEEAAA